MAKNFPYFKFFPTEWLTGNIAYEDLEIQGLFINICSIYWQRDGVLSIEDIKRRYKKENLIDSLVSGSFIKVENELISIDFLNEQLDAANHISRKNSENGKKSAALKALKLKEKSTTVELSLNESSTNKNKNKNESKLEVNNIDSRKLKFADTLKPYLEKYGRDMLKDFYQYWTEPNKSGTKFKQEMLKTWDVSRRLETWSRNDFGKNKTVKGQEATQQQINLGTR